MLLKFLTEVGMKGGKKRYSRSSLDALYHGYLPFFGMGCILLCPFRISYSTCSLASRLTSLDHIRGFIWSWPMREGESRLGRGRRWRLGYYSLSSPYGVTSGWLFLWTKSHFSYIMLLLSTSHFGFQ